MYNHLKNLLFRLLRLEILDILLPLDLNLQYLQLQHYIRRHRRRLCLPLQQFRFY
jgi:hypothetical protein